MLGNESCVTQCNIHCVTLCTSYTTYCTALYCTVPSTHSILLLLYPLFPSSSTLKVGLAEIKDTMSKSSFSPSSHSKEETGYWANTLCCVMCCVVLWYEDVVYLTDRIHLIWAPLVWYKNVNVVLVKIRNGDFVLFILSFCLPTLILLQS